MKYLKIFSSMEEFEAAKPSMDTLYIVLAGDKIVYSNLPEINEDDLTDGDYVDLGLPSGLKWATCNIGASTPCESGLLFQFGRVDGYAYGDTNHKFRTTSQNTADTGHKYIPITTSGKTYVVGEVLDPADDAAYQATNGKLRMPTSTEIDELLAETTNDWCQCTVLGDDHTSHTIMGRLFTSKTDDSKKIFIPAAGDFLADYGSFYSAGSGGYVWSSSVIDSGDTYRAYYLYFYSGNSNRKDTLRCSGFSVRGVKD